jgi:hypothetical protein
MMGMMRFICPNPLSPVWLLGPLSAKLNQQSSISKAQSAKLNQQSSISKAMSLNTSEPLSHFGQ